MIKVCKRIKFAGGVRVLCALHLQAFSEAYKTLSLTRDDCDVCKSLALAVPEQSPGLEMYSWTFRDGPDAKERRGKVLCIECAPAYLESCAAIDISKRQTFNPNYICKACGRVPGTLVPASD